jgi:hypothetical protein
MINYPSENKQWSQPNNSDLFGNVYATKNINFDDEGYLKLSGRSVSLMNELLDANVDQSAVTLFDDGGYFVQTWDKPFRINLRPLRDTAPAEITGSNVPAGNLRADATWFDNKLIVSETNDVKYRSGTDWFDTNISLATTTGGQHPIANFVSKSGWVVANVNTLLLYGDISTTPTLIETLTIPADFMITSLTYFNQQIYIGTRHTQGGKAVMYVWNGSGTAAQGAFEVDSHIIHDITTFQDSVVVFVSNGALLRFNGSGFTPLAYFPLFFTPFSLADYQNINHYHNCLKPNEDVLYINFSFTQESNLFLNQPAGVWCYEPKVGLYHKYSHSIGNAFYQNVTGANIDVSANTFTVGSGSIPASAICPVLFKSSATLITPLGDENSYWAIRLSSTSFKLAYTKADALAGNAIDISGSPSGTYYFTFCPELDYGHFLTNRAFAVMPINQYSTIYGTDVIWSSEGRTRSTTDLKGYVGTVSEALDSRGYFISPKVFSQETTDHFNNLVLKYFPLKNDDKIIIKYRTIDDGLNFINFSNRWGITWTSQNTFTTTETEWVNAVVGDEIEVLQGAGAGLLAHITSITVNTGTYTVTIDENFDNYLTGDIGIAVFRNWTKFLTLTSSDTDGFIERQLDVQGKFIQIKVELRGQGVKIEEIKIDNKYLLPSSK